MPCLDRPMLRDEAENCRQMALSFLGKREASILLRIAKEFDDLAGRSAEPSAWNAPSSGDCLPASGH